MADGEMSRFEAVRTEVTGKIHELRDMWDQTRIVDDVPEIPLVKELADEWKDIAAAPHHPDNGRLYLLHVNLGQAGHTLYHNIERRRLRFWKHRQAFWGLLEQRVDEIKGEEPETDGADHTDDSR